jgi:hypothetical protein
MGDWRYISIFLDLGSRWRWMVSLTPLLYYPQGKSQQYPLDRLGGPQDLSGCCGEEKILALLRIKFRKWGLLIEEGFITERKCHSTAPWSVWAYIHLIITLQYIVFTNMVTTLQKTQCHH